MTLDRFSRPVVYIYFQRRGEKSVPKITTNHSFDQGMSDRSFSKSIKKIYSIFNVHESPDTARRLGERFSDKGSSDDQKPTIDMSSV